MPEEITPPAPEEEAEEETPEEALSASGLGSAPGLAPAPEHRPSMLYNPDSGKLDVKKLATWVAAIAGFIASVSFVGAHVTEWTRWWLDIGDMETRVTSCEERLEQIEDSVPTEWRREDTPRDPNARLSTALPQIAQTLRDSQKERRRHDMAITRLSTIHEFGLTRSRERAAAVEARRSVRVRDADSEGDESPRPDPLSDLAGL